MKHDAVCQWLSLRTSHAFISRITILLLSVVINAFFPSTLLLRFQAMMQGDVVEAMELANDLDPTMLDRNRYSTLDHVRPFDCLPFRP